MVATVVRAAWQPLEQPYGQSNLATSRQVERRTCSTAGCPTLFPLFLASLTTQWVPHPLRPFSSISFPNTDFGRKGWVRSSFDLYQPFFSYRSLLHSRYSEDAPSHARDSSKSSLNLWWNSILAAIVKVRLFVYPPFASGVSSIRICDLAGRKGWGTHWVVGDSKKGRADT
jgi:hypothetical protein